MLEYSYQVKQQVQHGPGQPDYLTPEIGILLYVSGGGQKDYFV